MPFKPVALAQHIVGKPPAPLPGRAECGAASPAPGHADVPPVYAGFAKVLDYAIKALVVDRGVAPSTGMTAKFHLLSPDDPDVHPFKGLRCSRSGGHRLHVVLSQPRDGDDDLVLYSGEGMLTWWSEDCQSGMSATIRFDDGPDGAGKHPLSTLAAGRKGGDSVYLACWAVDDDESVQHPVRARGTARKPFSEMTAVQQSHIKCKRDERFQAWCAAEGSSLLPEADLAALPDFAADRVAFAEAVVRRYCGVGSRAEFNKDTAAGFAARQKWQEMLRRFEAWRRLPTFSPSDWTEDLPY